MQHTIKLILLLLSTSLCACLIVCFGLKSGSEHFFSYYCQFLINLSKGDLGQSIVSGQPVIEEIFHRWPATIELGLVAMVIALSLGMCLGLIAALFQGHIIDRLIIAGALVLYSIPVYWLGLMLIIALSVWLELTPISGRIGFEYDIVPITGFLTLDSLWPRYFGKYQWHAYLSTVSHLILPAIVVASTPIAIFARVIRSSFLDIFSKKYILNAHAKGLSLPRIIFIHAFKNTLSEIGAVIGLQFFANVFIGSMIVEYIFGWPGIGNYMLNSVYARDYPVVQACLFLFGSLVLILNLCMDSRFYHDKKI